MIDRLRKLLQQPDQQELLNKGLPAAFDKANAKHRRKGKVGQEVGITREIILQAYLESRLGKESVTSAGGPTSRNDLTIDGCPIEIKTVTGAGRVKVSWTVDTVKSDEFISEYKPTSDLLLVRIWWGQKRDSIFHIPQEVAEEVALNSGKELAKIKHDTNNRGVEYSKDSMDAMESHSQTLKIPIAWGEESKNSTALQDWLNYWNQMSGER